MPASPPISTVRQAPPSTSSSAAGQHPQLRRATDEPRTRHPARHRSSSQLPLPTRTSMVLRASRGTMAIRAAWGCGGSPPRAAELPPGPNRVDAGVRPLRAVADAGRRGRRAGCRVARRLAVLQPQPGGVAPAGAAVPRHQHGAVRPAGAAGRPGRRPLPPRLPLDQRAPRRTARRCAPSPSPSPSSSWRCTSSPSPCSCRPRRAASCARRSCRRSSTNPTSSSPPTRRLARLNVVAGGVGGAIGGAVLWLTSSPALTLALACGTFVASAVVHAHAAVDHATGGAHAERRVRGAARPDDRRHGVGVHRRACRRRLLRVRSGVRPAPRERAGVDVRRGRRGLRRRHVRRQRRRPAAASPLRRGPADGRCARRAGDRRRLRRTRARPAPSSCSCRSSSAASPRSPARASTRWSRRTLRLASQGPVVRPLRDPVPARLGRRCDRRHGDRHPDPCQPRRRRAGPDPRRRPVRPGPARGPRGPRRGSVRPARGRPAAHRARHRVEPPPARTASPSPSSPASSTSPGRPASTSTRRPSPGSTPCVRPPCRRGRSTPARSTGRWTRRTALMARLESQDRLAGSGAVGRAAPTTTSRSTATDPRRSSGRASTSPDRTGTTSTATSTGSSSPATSPTTSRTPASITGTCASSSATASARSSAKRTTASSSSARRTSACTSAAMSSFADADDEDHRQVVGLRTAAAAR